MIAQALDALVASGRVTGYTIERDADYLVARRPTLTYRMYADGSDSHRNVGEFASTMAYLGARSVNVTRAHGAVVNGADVLRSRQVCVTAEFDSEAGIEAALDQVLDRFASAPAAAPGSWIYPDLRVTAAKAHRLLAVHAFRWPVGRLSAVVLAVDEAPPAPGAQRYRLRVHPRFESFLRGGRDARMACSAP